MKVFIFGNRGNMGRRYASVLKYLGHEACGCDLGDNSWTADYQNADGVIIATSTVEHAPLLRFLIPDGKPVLCEKPISTDIGMVKRIVRLARETELPLTMVSQYDYLLERAQDGSFPRKGPTTYDFYQSGKDGLAWDCINIIWHANSTVELKNESPIWRCSINGVPLDIGLMNHAYVEMIDDWLNKPYKPQYDRILAAHQKVVAFLEGRLWKI